MWQFTSGLAGHLSLHILCSRVARLLLKGAQDSKMVKTYDLEIGTASHLSHSPGQSKSQDQPRFQEKENRLHLILARVTRVCDHH